MFAKHKSKNALSGCCLRSCCFECKWYIIIFLENLLSAVCSYRADSITWNPHKSIGAPLQCSCFVTKHRTILADCNSVCADYLFQRDKLSYDSSLDSGDKSIQCGRLADVFKLWLMWKHEVHNTWLVYILFQYSLVCLHEYIILNISVRTVGCFGDVTLFSCICIVLSGYVRCRAKDQLVNGTQSILCR